MILPTHSRIFHAAVSVIGSVVAGSLLGCGVALAPTGTSSGNAISGKAMGGQQPISGASIYFYASGSSGPGLGATSLVTTPAITDSQGDFSLTGNYTCPSASAQVYLVSRGGNPGLANGTNNPAAVLMAALGSCGNLTASTFVTINEATTAAAAWGLSQFLAPGGVVGSSATNTLGLQNGFTIARTLADVGTGMIPSSNLPAGVMIEDRKLATLADAIAGCVNSDGSGACTALFAASTIGSNVPTNTLDALRNIVQNPANQVAAVFKVVPTQGPFQPILSSAPNDWTMTVTYSGGGIAAPTAVAVDPAGGVWVANYSGVNVTKISPGTSAQAFPASTLQESYGITVDGQGNVWVTDQETDPSVNSGYGSVTRFNSSGQVTSGTGFSGGGVYYPYAIAADSNSSIWVADFGHSAASVLASDGSPLTGSTGYSSQSLLPFPNAVALDANHNAWFAAQSRVAKVTPAGAITSWPCCQAASGVAVDQSGNVWLADFSGPSVVEVSSTGTILQTVTGVAGISYPESIAIDGSGNVWVANYRGASISSLSAGPASIARSPGGGFGLDAALLEPFGIAIDASGNVWVSNFAKNSVTEFVGLATPVATPLLGPAHLP